MLLEPSLQFMNHKSHLMSRLQVFPWSRKDDRLAKTYLVLLFSLPCSWSFHEAEKMTRWPKLTLCFFPPFHVHVSVPWHNRHSTLLSVSWGWLHYWPSLVSLVTAHCILWRCFSFWGHLVTEKGAPHCYFSFLLYPCVSVSDFVDSHSGLSWKAL